MSLFLYLISSSALRNLLESALNKFFSNNKYNKNSCISVMSKLDLLSLWRALSYSYISVMFKLVLLSLWRALSYSCISVMFKLVLLSLWRALSYSRISVMFSLFFSANDELSAVEGHLHLRQSYPLILRINPVNISRVSYACGSCTFVSMLVGSQVPRCHVISHRDIVTSPVYRGR